ncbi:MAG TPA: hypothetical protein VI197_33450 [Polyangiaceae bacterium]
MSRFLADLVRRGAGVDPPPEHASLVPAGLAPPAELDDSPESMLEEVVEKVRTDPSGAAQRMPAVALGPVEAQPMLPVAAAPEPAQAAPLREPLRSEATHDPDGQSVGAPVSAQPPLSTPAAAPAPASRSVAAHEPARPITAPSSAERDGVMGSAAAPLRQAHEVDRSDPNPASPLPARRAPDARVAEAEALAPARPAPRWEVPQSAVPPATVRAMESLVERLESLVEQLQSQRQAGPLPLLPSLPLAQSLPMVASPPPRPPHEGFADVAPQRRHSDRRWY